MHRFKTLYQRTTVAVCRLLGSILYSILGIIGPASVAEAEGQLMLYNWGDYINLELIQIFSQEYDIDVTLDSYSSNEELLARVQNGDSGYDLVWPSVHMHDIMQRLGLLQPTYVNLMPGFENIDPRAILSKEDPKADYCLPYAWGTVGIFYNKKLVPKLSSWQDFFDYAAQNPGRVTLLDDPRETIGVGLIMTGASVNSTDPEEIARAADFINAHKPNLNGFAYDIIPRVISGDLAAAHYYVGTVNIVNQHPDLLDFIIPKEGATMYHEDLCLLTNAPNLNNAMLFLEFLLRPEISALNTTYMTNGSVNLKAKELLPNYLRNNPVVNPPPNIRKMLQVIRDRSDVNEYYIEAWNRIKDTTKAGEPQNIIVIE